MKRKNENKKGSFLLHILCVRVTPRQWQRSLINEAQDRRALSLTERRSSPEHVNYSLKNLITH